uniref:UPF0095 protein Cmaq_0169 n=1 Tax=Anthurium amnicola TaxID=1678845 RepID=A0A1D1XIM1_9ARAE
MPAGSLRNDDDRSSERRSGEKLAAASPPGKIRGTGTLHQFITSSAFDDATALRLSPTGIEQRRVEPGFLAPSEVSPSPLAHCSTQPAAPAEKKFEWSGIGNRKKGWWR